MADVTLQITIPDANITRVLAALTTLAGKRLMVEADSPDWRGRISYSYAIKGVIETNRDFATRAIKEGIKALVRMVDLAEDEERYRVAVAIIPSPVQDVPDNIVV